MRKQLTEPLSPTAPDVAGGHGAEDLQNGHEAALETSKRSPRRSSDADTDDSELVKELELRLREWVERVDTLETELGYLKRELEIRILYARELESQLDARETQVADLKHELEGRTDYTLEVERSCEAALNELAAIRVRAAYRIMESVVTRAARRPALFRVAHGSARRMIAWRDR